MTGHQCYLTNHPRLSDHTSINRDKLGGKRWNPLQSKSNYDSSISKVFQICSLSSGQLAFYISQYSFTPIEYGASKALNRCLHLGFGSHMWSYAPTQSGYSERDYFNIKPYDCFYINIVIFGINFFITKFLFVASDRQATLPSSE